jgi:hypothetical protein
MAATAAELGGHSVAGIYLLHTNTDVDCIADRSTGGLQCNYPRAAIRSNLRSRLFVLKTGLMSAAMMSAEGAGITGRHRFVVYRLYGQRIKCVQLMLNMRPCKP